MGGDHIVGPGSTPNGCWLMDWMCGDSLIGRRIWISSITSSTFQCEQVHERVSPLGRRGSGIPKLVGFVYGDSQSTSGPPMNW